MTPTQMGNVTLMANRLDLNLHDDDADLDDDGDDFDLDEPSGDDGSGGGAHGVHGSENGEPASLAITQPVVFPAWRDQEEFESFVSPDSVHVVLRLDDDADITRLNSSVSYWPAEFILPLDPADGPWTAQTGLGHAQTTADQAGDDYFNGGISWKTIAHGDGVTELGRYERNDAEHVIALLQSDDHEHASLAFCEADDGDATYCSLHDFDDFEEVDRMVIDAPF